VAGKQATGGSDVLPTQASGNSYLAYLAATGWNEADGTGSFSPLTRAVDFAAGTGMSVAVSGKTVTYTATGGGTGTVTSVGVSGANGIGVSGSPVTSSGTIALSLGAITPTSVASTGPVSGTSFTATGSTAGYLDLPQGTTNAAGTTSIRLQAPASVTSQLRTYAGTPATGYPFWTNTAGSMVETLVGVTGTGNVVQATSPTLVTPALGVATATSINGTAIPASATLAQTIASGTAALGTSAIASATCATAVTATATGTATTDVVAASFNGDPTAVTGYIPATAGMLTIVSYPTANTVNFKVCNNTSSSITPGAITINWRVTR
jgi:hypothetical protein